MKHRNKRHGRTTAGQTLSLQMLELGASLPSRLVFRSEIADLTKHHVIKEGLNSSTFSSSRHAYVAQLVPSPDKALLAVASSDGRIEIHEPADTQTLRLCLLPNRGATLSSVAWGSICSSDCILVGLRETAIALYDLNTCQVDRPTRKFPHSGRNLSDIKTLDNNTFAVSIPERIEVYDARIKKSIAIVATSNRDAVLAGEDIFLYAADNGEVALWDRRKLHSPGSAGNYASMTKRCDAALSRMTFTKGRFNDLCLIPGAAPGTLFFFHSNGTVGHIDIVGKTVESVPEEEFSAFDGLSDESGLNPYGTSERSLEYPWYVHRRRADVICAPQTFGWRAIVPNVKTKGYRFIGFASDMGLQNYRGSHHDRRHYSCAHAVDGQLNRIIFGNANNGVEVHGIDTGTVKESHN